MNKEIIMTIPEFMEMQRGNKTIKDIENKTLKNKTITLISVLAFFLSVMPPPALAVTPTQVTNDGITVIYVTATVLLQCFYELVTQTASIL